MLSRFMDLPLIDRLTAANRSTVACGDIALALDSA